MASQVELRLSVPVEQARELVGTSLTEQGFTVQVVPSGSFDVSRGSLGTTLVAGALAGQDMHVRFDVDFLPAEHGSVVRVRSSAVGGFLKGGAIGASNAGDVVREATHQLGVRLSAQGVLLGSTPFESASDAYPPSGDPYGSTNGQYPSPPSAAAWQGGGIPAPVDYANRTNVVSIVALILGFVVPVGGIIAGAVALAQVKRTGEKGRGLAIGGIIVGSVLTLLIVLAAIAAFVIGLIAANAASEIATAPSPSFSSPSEDGGQASEAPDSVDVFSLSVGDCLNDADTDEVTSVEVIDCAQPHDLEVSSEFQLEGDTYPGEDQVNTLADDGCRQAFASFVGIPFDDSALDYTYFVPTQDSWDTAGDRLVSCMIYEPGVQTTGSLAGAAR